MFPPRPLSSLPDAEDGEIVESAVGSIAEERYSPPLSHDDDGEIIEVIDDPNPKSSRSVRNRPPTPMRLPLPPRPGPPSPGPPASEWSSAPMHSPPASHPPSSGRSGFLLRSGAQPFYPSQPSVWREWHQATSSSPPPPPPPPLPTPPPPTTSAPSNHRHRGRPNRAFKGRSRFQYPSNTAAPLAGSEILAQEQSPYHSPPQFQRHQDPFKDKRPYRPQMPYALNGSGPSHAGLVPTREEHVLGQRPENFCSSGINISPSVGSGGLRSDENDYRVAQDFRIHEQYQARRDYLSREEYPQHGFYATNAQNSFVSRDASVERIYSPQPSDYADSEGESDSGHTQGKAELINDGDVIEDDDARRAEEEARAKEAEEQEIERRLAAEARAKEFEKRKKKLRLQALRSMARIKKGRPASAGGSATPTPSPPVDDSAFPPLPGQDAGPLLPPGTKRRSKHKTAKPSYASSVRDSGFPPLPSARPTEPEQLTSAVSPSVAQAFGTAPKAPSHHLVPSLPPESAPGEQAVPTAPTPDNGAVPRPPSLQLPSSQTQKFVTNSRTSYQRVPPVYSQSQTPMAALTPTTPISAVVKQQTSFAVHVSPNKDPLKFMVSSSEDSSACESDSDSDEEPRERLIERHIGSEKEEENAEQKEDLESEATAHRKQIEAKQRALQEEREHLRREMTKLEERKKHEQRKKTSPGCSARSLSAPPMNPCPRSSAPSISVPLQNGLKRDFGTLENCSGTRQEKIASQTKSPSSDLKLKTSTPTKRQKVGNTSISPGKSSQTPLRAKTQPSSSPTSPESSIDETGTPMPASGSGSPVRQKEIRSRKLNGSTGNRIVISPWNMVSAQPRGEPEQNVVLCPESELQARVGSLQSELRSLSRDFVQQKEYVRLLVKAERSHAQCVERARKSRMRVAALQAELEDARGAHAKDEEDRRKSHASLVAVHELGPQIGLELSSLCAEASASVENDMESAPGPTLPVRVSPSNSIPTTPPRESNSASLVLSDCAVNAAGETRAANRTEDVIMMPSPFSPVPFDRPYRSVTTTLRA